MIVDEIHERNMNEGGFEILCKMSPVVIAFWIESVNTFVLSNRSRVPSHHP